MRRIILGSLIGTVIFFGFQSVMWMGGFNKNISLFTSSQDAIMKDLGKHNLPEGLYMMPYTDPGVKDFDKVHRQSMIDGIGKPWALVFYHPAMKAFQASTLLTGVLYTLIACLIVSIILYNGRFSSFSSRFLIAMSFALFSLSIVVMSQMNWWSYPWSFVKAQVTDLTIGWGLCSAWLAFYVKNKAAV